MTFACSIEQLIAVLHTRTPALADLIAVEKRRVIDGLLSVGLKIHGLGPDEPFHDLFEALGGREKAVEQQGYRSANAKFCLVLPPLGSAETTIRLVESLEQYLDYPLFGNNEVSMQVCSPGRLNQHDVIRHAAAFYLASDKLRQYHVEDFATTFSEKSYARGRRLVLYDADYNSAFDKHFPYWVQRNGALHIEPTIPFVNQRTDIQAGTVNADDIRTINLVATLLVHGRPGDAGGYWFELGTIFRNAFTSILERHDLASLFESNWVRTGNINQQNIDVQAIRHEDEMFMRALNLLMERAHADAKQVTHKKWGDVWAQIAQASHAQGHTGLLAETADLLTYCRETMRIESNKLTRRSTNG